MLPRKLRRCRPVIDAMEHIALGSTPVLGLLVTTPAATVARTAGGGANSDMDMAQSGGAMPISIQDAPPISVPSPPRLALTGTTTTVGDPGSSSTDSSAVSAQPVPRSASDRELFDNLIALVTPAEAPSPSDPAVPAATTARAAAQPQSGGRTPAPNPIGVAPASTPPAMAPSAATTALPGASPTAGIIRPMALAPGQANQGAAAAHGFRSPAPAVGHPGGRVGTGRGHRVGIGHGVAMASGSGQGSGGGSGSGIGDPYLVYSGSDGATDDTRTPKSSFTDLTGDNVAIVVGDNKGHKIATTSWDVSASAIYVYQNQNYNIRTGFSNPNYIPPSNAPSITFCWGQYPGTYTVTADVTYADPNIPPATVKLAVGVVQPTGNIVVNSVGTPSLTPDGSSEKLSSAASGSVGISFTATVDPTVFVNNGLSGRFGVIQTIQPFTVIISWQDAQGAHTKNVSVSNPPGGPQTQPRPVADDAGPPAVYLGTFYGNHFGAVDGTKTPPTAPLPLNDTPSVSPAATRSGASYVATFTDTLTFQPSGGIWVPLGNFTWTVNLSATNNGGTWVNGSQPTTYTGYARSTAYANWVESDWYLWSTYGQFVQTS